MIIYIIILRIVITNIRINVRYARKRFLLLSSGITIGILITILPSVMTLCKPLIVRSKNPFSWGNYFSVAPQLLRRYNIYIKNFSSKASPTLPFVVSIVIIIISYRYLSMVSLVFILSPLNICVSMPLLPIHVVIALIFTDNFSQWVVSYTLAIIVDSVHLLQQNFIASAFAAFSVLASDLAFGLLWYVVIVDRLSSQD